MGGTCYQEKGKDRHYRGREHPENHTLREEKVGGTLWMLSIGESCGEWDWERKKGSI